MHLQKIERYVKHFLVKMSETNTSQKLPEVSFSEAPLFFSEELHSHFCPINVSRPAAIKATMLQPEKDSITEGKQSKMSTNQKH